MATDPLADAMIAASPAPIDWGHAVDPLIASSRLQVFLSMVQKVRSFEALMRPPRRRPRLPTEVIDHITGNVMDVMESETAIKTVYKEWHSVWHSAWRIEWHSSRSRNDRKLDFDARCRTLQLYSRRAHFQMTETWTKERWSNKLRVNVSSTETENQPLLFQLCTNFLGRAVAPGVAFPHVGRIIIDERAEMPPLPKDPTAFFLQLCQQLTHGETRRLRTFMQMPDIVDDFHRARLRYELRTR